MPGADVPAVGHVKQVSYPVRHQVDNFFHGQNSLVYHLKHGRQGVLNEWPAGRCLEVRAGLFIGGVRSVVRGDDVDAPIQDAGADGFAILRCFDGGVPLDVGAFRGVIGIGEPEVVNACLSRDALLGGRDVVAEQPDLFGR